MFIIRMNGEANAFDITLPEAINCISQADENFQLYGASFIQHNSFTDEKAKEEVSTEHKSIFVFNRSNMYP